MFKLHESELQRINKILQKAVDKETGKLSEDDESLTEDNPDGRKYSVLRFYRKKQSIFNFVFPVDSFLPNDSFQLAAS